MSLVVDGGTSEIDSEVMARFNSFTLSEKEAEDVNLLETDVCIGLEAGNRSLIGRLFGKKRANFQGIKNAMIKIWQHRGLCKVVSLTQNVYQFVFKKAGEREVIMQDRPWLFDNFLLVLHYWTEDLKWSDKCFNFSPMWIQVLHVLNHWASIETGRKIGNKLGEVKDIRLIEAGGKEEQVLKILAVLDLTKPLQRGSKLKYRQSERWIEFRYEQLPIFCFYCGRIGHNERLCLKRGKDVECDSVSPDQYGYWLKAGSRKPAGWGGRNEGSRKDNTIPTVTKGAGETEVEVSDLEERGKGTKITDGVGVQRGLDSREKELGQLVRDTTEEGAGVKGGQFEGVDNMVISEDPPMAMGDDQKNALPCPDRMMLALGEKEVTGGLHEGDTQLLQGGWIETVPPAVHRTPLMDCTNSETQGIGAVVEHSMKRAKGQWKRKARMHGEAGCLTSLVVEGLQENASKKRDLAGWQEELEPVLVTQGVKKIKKTFSDGTANITEVEETSRNWSQMYK